MAKDTKIFLLLSILTKTKGCADFETARSQTLNRMLFTLTTGKA